MQRLVASFRDRVRYLALPLREAKVGASRDNDLVLPFPGVSRYHALARPQDGGLLLVDAGSKNGLIVERGRVHDVLLRSGDAVRIGSVILTLEEISTSDGEVALALDSPAGHSSTRQSPRETDALSVSASEATAARAFALVRTLEALGETNTAEHRTELLGRAAPILGAQTLITFRLGTDGFSAQTLYGPYPEERAVEILVDAARFARMGKGRVAGSANLLVFAGPEDRHLAAVFVAPEVPTAPWKRAFFEYLGGWFLGISPEHESEEARSSQELALPPGMIIGPSPAMQGLLNHLRATVRSRLDVLLLGETGTGKEVFARLIHASGPTPKGPFVAVNCAAIPGELLEAELFGIQGRVATNVDARTGLFLQAQGGTVFLDEIGDMPEKLQSKLLRVLQEREVVPVGGNAATKLNVRVVSASNRDLPDLVRQGAFRADLYYRLRGLEFRIPPLRERCEDLPLLALEFASRAAKKYDKRIRGISRKALRQLVAHPWQGNVRELESAIEQAVLLCPHGGTLASEHLNLADSEPTVQAPAPQAPASPLATFVTLQERVDDLERDAIAQALAAAKGRKGEAAKLLGLSRQGLLLKIKRLRIG